MLCNRTNLEGSRKCLKMSDSQWPNKKEDYELKDVIGRLNWLS